MSEIKVGTFIKTPYDEINKIIDENIKNEWKIKFLDSNAILYIEKDLLEELITEKAIFIVSKLELKLLQLKGDIK